LDKHRATATNDGARAPARSLDVRVTLFADLRKYISPGQPGSRRCRLAAGATVADLVAELGIPPGELMTVGVNGELAARDTVLGDGDDVALFSPMEGG
jgi:molybdopterin converting factor small subunit